MSRRITFPSSALTAGSSISVADGGFPAASSVLQDEPASLSSASGVVIPASNFIPPAILDKDELYKAYCQLLVEKGSLANQVKMLTAQLGQYTLIHYNKTKKQQARSESVDALSIGSTTDDSTDQLGSGKKLSADIRKCGQHFVLFHSVFVDVKAFEERRPQFSHDSLERWSTPENEKLGITAELYACMPEKYHSMMELAGTHASGKALISEFRNAISSSRSTIMKNLRQFIAPLIFNQSSHMFETNFTTRDEVEEFTRLLGMKISPSGKTTYALFSPLICLNDDPSDPKNYFRSPRLFMSARGFVFGPNATSGESKSAMLARGNNAYLRPGIEPRTTEGFIAANCVMLSNVVSKDTSFDGSGIGKQSQINYGANFDQIKRFLITAKFKQPGYHRRLMDEWDREVFSEQLKKNGNHPDAEYIDIDEDPETQIDREMERLAIAESQLADSEAPDAHILSNSSIDPFETDRDADIYADDPPIDISADPILEAPTQPVVNVNVHTGIIPPPSALDDGAISHLPLKEGKPDLGTISTHPTAGFAPGPDTTARKPVTGLRGGRGGPKKAPLAKRQVQTTEAAPRRSTRPKATAQTS